MPFTLTPSSLSLFRDCPRCFWLQQVRQIKRPEGIYPSLPYGVDRVLKERFDWFRERSRLPAELRALGKKVKLYDNVMLAVWRNTRAGLRWKDEYGNMLKGAVNDLLEADGKLAVLEYVARGFAVKRDTASYYQDKLDLYTLLLVKNGYAVASQAYLLFYHPKQASWKGDLWLHKELRQRYVSAKKGEELFQKALAVLEQKMPPAQSENCQFCRWKSGRQ